MESNEKTAIASPYVRQTTPEQNDLELQIELELEHPCFHLSCLLPVLSERLDVCNLLECRDCPIQLQYTNCSNFNLRLTCLKRWIRDRRNMKMRALWEKNFVFANKSEAVQNRRAICSVGFVFFTIFLTRTKYCHIYYSIFLMNKFNIKLVINEVLFWL